MGEALTIVVNTQTKAASQYIGSTFDSVAEFNGEAVFFGSTGVFEEGGDTDNSASISAWVDTPLHDFGTNQQKSLAGFSVGYETDGDVSLTLYGDEDEDTSRTIVIPPVRDGHAQHDVTRSLRRYKHGKARYWKVRFSNVDGSDFSLDYLALAPVFLQRGSY